MSELHWTGAAVLLALAVLGNESAGARRTKAPNHEPLVRELEPAVEPQPGSRDPLHLTAGRLRARPLVASARCAAPWPPSPWQPSWRRLPGAPGSAMLLLLFDPPAGLDLQRVCASSPLPAAVPSPEPLRLVAVFCDGRTFIADATGSTSGMTAADVDRLVWRTVGALFPDDYPETYGIRNFLGL